MAHWGRAAWAMAVVALVGCSGGGIDVDLPTPPPRTATTTTTQPFDGASVVLASVPGRTTLPPPTAVPGPSALRGVVRGPDGPVPGATVRVERFVESGIVATDVISALDGTWRLEGIPGGRYRLRAWRVPDLAGRPIVLFLEAARPAAIDLVVDRGDGLVATAALAPARPVVDEPANIAVVVAQRAVDDQGIVRATPLAAVAVELVALGAWSIRPPTAIVTDGAGRADWQVTCRRLGDQGLAVAVGDAVVELEIPACVVRPPSTTAASTTTTSTTIRPRGRPSPPTSG